MSKVIFAGICGLCFFTGLSFFSESASAQVVFGTYGFNPVRPAEPGWAPYVLASPQTRSRLAQMPLEQRPYRPFHFYGNTVRRTYYRGTPLPSPRDLMPPIPRVILRR